MVEKLGSIGIAITWPPKDGALPPPTRLEAPSQPQEPSRALQVGAFSPCLPHPTATPTGAHCDEGSEPHPPCTTFASRLHSLLDKLFQVACLERPVRWSGGSGQCPDRAPPAILNNDAACGGSQIME